MAPRGRVLILPGPTDSQISNALCVFGFPVDRRPFDGALARSMRWPRN